jgi:hypothetical protein
LASTSASRELLERCLADTGWTDDLLRRSLAEDEGRAFFAVVVERLGDLFEPRLCDTYARLFARVVELVRPEYRAEDLTSRYCRVRRIRRCSEEPENVFVLSRVTLGADVAVTSVILDAVKRRFPHANIWFAGSRKNYELFADDARLSYLAWPYPRSGTLEKRIARAPQLPSGGIVVDTDSRLTQLGMLPVCEEDRYYFFESRAYGADTRDPLPVLAARWAEEVFGVKHSRAYIAPARKQMPFDAAVSFGVGENDRKRIDGPFEEELLRRLVDGGFSVVLDKGAGGQETQRAEALVARVPAVQLYEGPYAPFASMISQARLYVGYDSAGQHVAAASATPLVSIFAGYPSERFYDRWRPHGRGTTSVIRADGRTPEQLLDEVAQYLTW